MAKTKFVDVNNKPVVTHSYSIEVTIKVLVYVESTCIQAAEIEALNNSYTVMCEGLKDPESVYIDEVELA
jgi:phosphatidylglycerophosphatase A